MDDGRVGLTFAQAEGAEELPRQLLLREVSPELRAVLWAFVYEHLSRAVVHPGIYGGASQWSEPWHSVLKMWWIIRLHNNVDEIPPPDRMLDIVKSHMTKGDYIKVFDFLQFVIGFEACPKGFPETIDKLLSTRRSSYRVVDKYIIPLSSDEQADAVRSALGVAQRAEARGPHTHLRTASEALSQGKWSEAVRESIHAVESAAKSVEPSAATLGPALDKLKVTIGLNQALVKAYKALYGYSSDEKGVRHALVFEGVANVTEHDAIFMFGACASFVGYLLTVSRMVESKAAK